MNKNKSILFFINLLLTIIVTSSCVSKKEIIYLQDIDDSSENMESVQPFNKVVNPVSNQELNVRSQESLQSYLVNNEGNINYPLLGTIPVSGLTRLELEKKIQEKLLKYVKDASVDVRILNYKVTVLGEVNRPGTFNVDDNRITLLQALGLAGDLSVYGKRDNIMVIRDVNGIQKSARIDITSANFIYSPYYYLNQNDTVVVEPNGAQIQASGFNRNLSIYVSIASLLLTTVVAISNLNRR